VFGIEQDLLFDLIIELFTTDDHKGKPCSGNRAYKILPLRDIDTDVLFD
jgi:hypothetical protein